MPWKGQTLEEQRCNFVLKAQKLQWGEFSQLCRESGISRPTGYLWLRRYRESGSLFESFSDRSRRPAHSPNRTSKEIEKRVLWWRRREGWGAKKIREKLLAEGYMVPVITINRILKRLGLVSNERFGYHATLRFERELPNQLVQMDFKGEYRIEGGYCYPLSLLDDHSRFAVGLYALGNRKGSSVQSCLIKTFESSGVPKAILVDHGTPWWGPTNIFGLTWLSVWLLKQGIRIHYSGYRHPQTQGKVERFHRTLKESLRHHGNPQTLSGFKSALARFKKVYNHQRPHEALQMAVPASRYQPSDKSYNPKPAEWEYPEGAIVNRLNSQGILTCPGGRRFVCEALANELVQIIPIDHRWLIKYRHQLIREINTKTGKTLPPGGSN
jgi:transposase InsO family protein